MLRLFLAVISLMFISQTAADEAICTRGFRTIQSLNDWETQSEIRRYSIPKQYLYPAINFTCSGTVTRFIVKINHEVLGVNFSSYTYPELQIWRPNAGSLYRKVGSATADMTPPFRWWSHVYVITPNSPLSFQAGDILGVWEGPTIIANTRAVDRIHHITTGGYSYNASSPQNEFSSSDHQLRQISTPLVAIETDPPECNSFISHETLATYATRLSCTHGNCTTIYQLHLIPEMSFHCDGNITGWTAGATWVQRHREDVLPAIQVWRAEQAPGSGSDRYTRVASVPFNPITPTNLNYNGGEFRKRLFSNTFDTPIRVRRGDILGLVVSSVGQMKMHLAEVPFLQLPRNYVFLGDTSDFPDMTSVDLQAAAFIQSLRPALSLNFIAESLPVETTPTVPQTTTPPITTPPATTTTVPPSPSTLLTTVTSTTSTKQDDLITSPATSTTEVDGHTTTSTVAGGVLEQKHIFGMIVSFVLLLVLLLVLSVTAVVAIMFVRSRRRRDVHFVPTFIETTDNEAYRSRRALLARTDRRQQRRDRHTRATGLHHQDAIATTGNIAYQNGLEASRHNDIIHPVTSEQGHCLKMKVNEAYNMEVGNTCAPTLPETGEASSKTMASVTVEVSNTKTKAFLVKPYQITILPGAVV